MWMRQPVPSPGRRDRRARSGRPLEESLERRAVPAAITVTTVGDAGPGSLRDAIERANLDPAPDEIDFAPSATGTIRLAGALPELTGVLAVRGPGAASLTVARDSAPGTPEFRVFAVAAGARVDLAGLTISGGQVSVVPGGGILNAVTLRVSGSIISGNTATSGGGIANAGTLTIAGSTISGNLGNNFGGGIHNEFGTLTVTGSTISGNRTITGGGGGTSTGGGGGISSIGTSSALTITDSTIGGNSANGGGGVLNLGTGTITGSTISGNSAFESVGGGGIGNLGTLTISNSTISGNSAMNSGGGINSFGALAISDSTIGGNSAKEAGGIRILSSGTLSLASSILANPAGGNLASNNPAAVASRGHNLFSDRPAVPLDPTDLTDADPRLGPLRDNGGPTFTRALLPGSPAIDAGAAVAGVTTDQRGVARPQGAAPDIGAFEAIPGQSNSTGPTVASVRRFGFHAAPTRVVLAFSSPLDPARAQDRRNYRIVGPDGKAVAIASATYDPAANTVTLRPHARLVLRKPYELTVIGTAPDGVADTSGVLLDGAGDGQPGSNYVATLQASDLVLGAEVPGGPRRLAALRRALARIEADQSKTPARPKVAPKAHASPRARPAQAAGGHSAGEE